MRRMSLTLAITTALVLTALGTTRPASVSGGENFDPGAGQTDPQFTNKITLEADQFGGDFAKWVHDWREADPRTIRFRWSHKLNFIGSAEWQVLNGQATVVARGKAPLPPANGFAQFTIDFRGIVGANKKRPLTYTVRVLTFGQLSTLGSTPKPSTGLPVGVSFVGSGPVTQFTMVGLRPELLSVLPLGVDLQTLRVVGGGDGQEPYLFVILVYADGTTIKPAIVGKNAAFPNSSVRVDSPAQTHGNITSGSVNQNAEVAIPPATGHFETFIRPIGLDLAKKFNLGSSMHARLRRFTRVGIAVVGLEEGSAPSTEVINEVRAEMLSEIQTQFDNILRGIQIPIDNPSALDAVEKALQAAINAAIEEITDRLKKSAKAKGIDEFFSYLKLPFGQAITSFLSFGALNRDEFVGSGFRQISYEDLLNAGEEGISFDIDLQNADNGLHYQVHGRARVR